MHIKVNITLEIKKHTQEKGHAGSFRKKKYI